MNEEKQKSKFSYDEYGKFAKKFKQYVCLEPILKQRETRIFFPLYHSAEVYDSKEEMKKHDKAETIQGNARILHRYSFYREALEHYEEKIHMSWAVNYLETSNKQNTRIRIDNIPVKADFYNNVVFETENYKYYVTWSITRKSLRIYAENKENGNAYEVLYPPYPLYVRPDWNWGGDAEDQFVWKD